MSGFPKRRFGIPVGWKDLGRMEGNYQDNGVVLFRYCKKCKSIAHVAEYRGERFVYCRQFEDRRPD